MSIVTAKYYEVFDNTKPNGTEYITTEQTLEAAIEVAKTIENGAVDVYIDIKKPRQEEWTTIFSMQVYPKLKDYNNHETKYKI